MKKLISIALLLTLTVSLCSCSREPAPAAPEIEGVLCITDFGKDYGSAATRAREVITAFTQQVALFVERNNGTIELNEPEKYFLDSSYILTTFAPFVSEGFDFSREFVKDASPGQLEQQAVSLGMGESVLFEKTGKTSYCLTVEGEGGFELRCDYNKKYDSLRYVRTDFDADEGAGKVTEFIEFAYVKGSGYFICSNKERCHISFDEQGTVTEFSYSCLSQGSYDSEEGSFYPDTSDLPGQFDSGWVAKGDKSAYLCIYTYDGEVFTYNDSSRGEWKTVTVE